MNQHTASAQRSSAIRARPVRLRALGGEFLGTAALVMIVVGSGIAAERLSPGDVGLQLLQNSFATALGLTVLILLFQPVSGAQLNPVVTVVDWVHSRRPHAQATSIGEAVARVGSQIVGAIAGCVVANLMFEAPVTFSTTERDGFGVVLGEVVATAGLILVILGLLRTGREALIAPAVGAYIGAAYWFTSSTSFANPAVTIGRTITDTFAGITLSSAPLFIAAQFVGAAVGLAIASLLFPVRPTRKISAP